MSNQTSNRTGLGAEAVVVVLVLVSCSLTMFNLTNELVSLPVTVPPSMTYRWPSLEESDDGNRSVCVIDDAPIVIEGDHGMRTKALSQGWPGDGSSSNPYVIENLGIFSSSVCISIENVYDCFVIRECFLYSGSASAMSIRYGGNCHIEHCSLYGASSAIDLRNMIATTVQDCRISSPLVGADVRNCTGLFVQSNSIRDCQTAISGSMDNSSIVSNTILNNTVGIGISNCRDSVIASNQIIESVTGIRLESGTNWIVQMNDIFSCLQYGLYLDEGAGGVLVVLNRFASAAVANARDDGNSNAWDDGISQGNQWSDYPGSGFYVISGSAHAMDHYASLFVPPPTPASWP